MTEAQRKGKIVRMARWLLIFLLLSFQSNTAHAFRFSILSGVSGYHVTSERVNPNAIELGYSPQTTFAAGLGIGFDLGRVFELEIDTLWTQYSFRGESPISPGYSTLDTWNVIQLPIIFRFVPNQIISAGVGLYFSYYRGNVMTQFITPTGVSKSGRSLDAADLPSYDFGYLAQAEIRLPFYKYMYFGFDARFLASLVPLNTNTDYHLSAKIYQGIIKLGVNFRP